MCSWYWPASQSLITWVETSTIPFRSWVRKISNSQPLSAHRWATHTLETVKEKSMSMKSWQVTTLSRLISSTLSPPRVFRSTKYLKSPFSKGTQNIPSAAWSTWRQFLTWSVGTLKETSQSGKTIPSKDQSNSSKPQSSSSTVFPNPQTTKFLKTSKSGPWLSLSKTKKHNRWKLTFKDSEMSSNWTNSVISTWVKK